MKRGHRLDLILSYYMHEHATIIMFSERDEVLTIHTERIQQFKIQLAQDAIEAPWTTSKSKQISRNKSTEQIVDEDKQFDDDSKIMIDHFI